VGNNPVATNMISARIMGFNPKSVPNLRYAEKTKTGTIQPKIAGDKHRGEVRVHILLLLLDPENFPQPEQNSTQTQQIRGRTFKIPVPGKRRTDGTDKRKLCKLRDGSADEKGCGGDMGKGWLGELLCWR